MLLMTCHNLDSARTVLDLVACGCSSNASFNRSSVRNYTNSYCKSSNRGHGARKLACRRRSIPCWRVSSTKTSGTLLNEVAQGPPSGLDLKKESRSSISVTSLFEVVAEDLLTLNQSLQSIERKLWTLPITTHFLEGLSKTQFPIFPTKLYQNQTHLSRPMLLFATLRGPRGFGPPPRKTKKSKKPNKENEDDEEEEEEEEEEEPDQGVIPEVVTNRMISRMGFSVGIPLFIGLLFFPFFYYLKVGLKIDVPTWVPFIVSFFFFGSALLGVSYGIVSSSWDPMREGSLLGWNEAKKNWPVFWQSLRGRSEEK